MARFDFAPPFLDACCDGGKASVGVVLGCFCWVESVGVRRVRRGSTKNSSGSRFAVVVVVAVYGMWRPEDTGVVSSVDLQLLSAPAKLQSVLHCGSNLAGQLHSTSGGHRRAQGRTRVLFFPFFP